MRTIGTNRTRGKGQPLKFALHVMFACFATLRNITWQQSFVAEFFKNFTNIFCLSQANNVSQAMFYGFVMWTIGKAFC